MQAYSQFYKEAHYNKEKILNINVNVSGRVNPESGIASVNLILRKGRWRMYYPKNWDIK
ncbi:hypothetical protein KUBF_18550 [Bacteroides finegoldii]|nr:hypothetical protein KUBF_18550 [Bacteroides finegoldii]